MLFKDADKSINIGQKYEWAYTTTLDYTTNEVCNVRETGVNFSLNCTATEKILKPLQDNTPDTYECMVYVLFDVGGGKKLGSSDY